MRVVGETVDYPGLIEAMRKRRRELGLSQVELDEAIGWAEGLTSKLETAPRPDGVGRGNFRALGPKTLPDLLQALGLRIVVIEDPDARPRRPSALGRHSVRRLASPAPVEAAQAAA
jgi:hypothetical protein